jgi:hypothetical protein
MDIHTHTHGWAYRSLEGWNRRFECVSFNLLNRRDLNDNEMLGPDHLEPSAQERVKQWLEKTETTTDYESNRCQN